MRTAIVVVTLAALCSESRAEPTAETLYSEGQAAYDRADYALAVDRWQASYRLSQEPALLYNVAQAYRMAGDCARALSSYRQFVTADPHSERRPFADEFIRELAATCGQPSVVPVVPVVQPPRRIERLDAGRHLKIAGIATSGAGAAIVITGLLIGRRASALGDEVSSACTQSCEWAEQRSKDARGRRDARIGYVLDGVGLAAIATGAVLYVLGDRKAAVSITPRSPEGGAAVTWSESW